MGSRHHGGRRFSSLHPCLSLRTRTRWPEVCQHQVNMTPGFCAAVLQFKKHVSCESLLGEHQHSWLSGVASPAWRRRIPLTPLWCVLSVVYWLRKVVYFHAAADCYLQPEICFHPIFITSCNSAHGTPSNAVFHRMMYKICWFWGENHLSGMNLQGVCFGVLRPPIWLSNLVFPGWWWISSEPAHCTPALPLWTAHLAHHHQSVTT